MNTKHLRTFSHTTILALKIVAPVFPHSVCWLVQAEICQQLLDRLPVLHCPRGDSTNATSSLTCLAFRENNFHKFYVQTFKTDFPPNLAHSLVFKNKPNKDS